MSSSKIPMQNDSESIVKRITLILSEYYKLTKNNKHTLIWSDLLGSQHNSSDEWLLSDFNFILDYLDDDEDLEQIQSQLLQHIVDKKDALNLIKEGSILYRHLVCDQWQYKTMQSISALYFQCSNHNDIVRYKLLDKMYCHLMFGHVLGLRLTNVELQSIDIAQSSASKLPNVDASLNELNHILSQKRLLWKQLKSEAWLAKYCDAKFVSYLTEKRQEEDSKSNDDNAPPQEEDRLKKVTITNEYSIGTRYYYEDWRYYSENYEKLKIEPSCIIRGSQWENLKLEMTQSNGGRHMSIDQWMILQLFCKILYQSSKCKKLKCDILKSDGHGVDIHYGLKQGDAIGLEHIISIYIYCNFPDIKRRFNRHLHDNKYSHFGRLLRETVEGFGISVFSDESENTFYHNIYVGDPRSRSNASYFNGYLALKFCLPTLMTTYTNIIHLYNADSKYITLNVCKYTNASSVNYFACNWLSDYSLDNECLFIGGANALKLTSIVIDNKFNYSHYLNAIHILSSLIKGKSNRLPIDNKLLFAIETLTKSKLESVMDHETEAKQSQEDTNSNDDYVMRIFTKFCDNVILPIYINLIWILDSSSNGYKAIKQWITNEDNSWIRFDVLCSLFPNVEKVKIGHRQFMLKSSTFDTFIAFFGDERENGRKCDYKLKEITFDDPNESNVSVKTIVNAYQHKLNQIGWKMESNKYHTKIFLTKKTQDNLWNDLIL
eukprot:407414_1